jgi:multiple sugar transport system ATP-binding protein
MGSPAMNLIPAVVDGTTVRMAREGTSELTIDFGALPSECAAKNGQEVIVGIRPEAIIDADGATWGRAEKQRIVHATCRIDVIEPAGADIYAITQLGGKEVVTRLHQDWSGQPGDEADLAFNLDKVVFFDPESGKRLR